MSVGDPAAADGAAVDGNGAAAVGEVVEGEEVEGTMDGVYVVEAVGCRVMVGVEEGAAVG